jgi:hypothetical protein
MLRILFALMCLALLGAGLAGCHASGSVGENTSADFVAR